MARLNVTVIVLIISLWRIKGTFIQYFPCMLGADEAVLLEPMGVAHNALEKLEVQGEAVLIIGCGPIGILASSIAKALGAAR